MTSLTHRLGGILLLGLLLMAGSACKAGPSAFDRTNEGVAESGFEDTADVSTLPAIPDAPSVETLSVSEEPGLSGETDSPVMTDSLGVTGAMAPLDAAPGSTSDSVTAGLELTMDADGRPAFQRPEHIRGIYLNAWASGSSRRVAALLDLAARTEVNAFVIDIKDATGYVSHRTAVPLAHEIGATEEIRIRDLPGLLSRLAEAGVYPIARIVIVKDPLLAAGRPEMAVQDTAGGVWVDGKGIIWMNPHDRRVWEYHVALAREVAQMGFPEIQWDYVRFPDAPRSELGRSVYPGAGDTTKADAIRAFLQYARDELSPLGVKITADVFGVTTSASRDVGIGQVWESFIDVVDAALPMVYPSHYWQGSFGIDTPNAYPYEIVSHALADAVRRSAKVEGAGSTRPWLQDFSLGDPPYQAPEVRAQIQGAYDVGVHEWILWNPSSRYTEDALEPVGGFVTEPMMRLGNQLVPVAERWEFLDSVAREGAAPDTVSVDTLQAGTVSADTIRPDTLRADSAGVR